MHTFDAYGVRCFGSEMQKQVFALLSPCTLLTPTASVATVRKCENKFSRFSRLAHFSILQFMNLAGKKILLGVSGGIAAYKSCELLRLLQKKGAEVRVCMTEAATQFVAPLTFASLSKCPVYLKNGAVEARPFQHIDFPRWADLYLVVPATANVIGKFVYGIADDPVSLCFMSCTGPRFIAPAMNVAMFNSPAVKRNLETLRSFENTFVMDSPAGELACGEVGKGRLLDPAEIVAYLERGNAFPSLLPLARHPLPLRTGDTPVTPPNRKPRSSFKKQLCKTFPHPVNVCLASSSRLAAPKKRLTPCVILATAAAERPQSQLPRRSLRMAST